MRKIEADDAQAPPDQMLQGATRWGGAAILGPAAGPPLVTDRSIAGPLALQHFQRWDADERRARHGRRPGAADHGTLVSEGGRLYIWRVRRGAFPARFSLLTPHLLEPLSTLAEPAPCLLHSGHPPKLVRGDAGPGIELRKCALRWLVASPASQLVGSG
jgi:hypothetical protein